MKKSSSITQLPKFMAVIGGDPIGCTGASLSGWVHKPAIIGVKNAFYLKKIPAVAVVHKQFERRHPCYPNQS